MVVKRGNKYCVVHGHPQKAGSKIDKPEGTVIKCFSTKEEAEAMHKAILVSQSKKKTQSFQRNIKLQSFQLQEFTEQEILNLIPRDTLEEIKKKDEHPFFQVYSICHPGISKPKLLDTKDQRPVKWTSKAVQSLKNMVLKGIKFFNLHNKDNSINNREDYGEIIYNFEKEINGKPNHCVIGYFPDKSKVIDKDIVSQESIWNIIDNGVDLIAESIEKITGIAMGSSNNSSPAFEGAKRLGTLQCNEEKDYHKFLEEEECKMCEKILEEELKLKEKL